MMEVGEIDKSFHRPVAATESGHRGWVDFIHAAPFGTPR